MSLPTGAPGPSPRTIVLKRSISLATTPPAGAPRSRHRASPACEDMPRLPRRAHRARTANEFGRASLGEPQQLLADRVVVSDDGDLRRAGGTLPRSEEHTSELQSPDHLVCRLLL